jgi:hypothetical protein
MVSRTPHGSLLPTDHFPRQGLFGSAGQARSRVTARPLLQELLGRRGADVVHDLAIDTLGVIPLVDRSTGREYARLDDPHGGTIVPVSFTPDGTRLIAIGQEPVRGIRVWDLRLLRERLRELDLDWDGDEFPPPVAPAGTHGRPTAIVDRGYLDPLLK